MDFALTEEQQLIRAEVANLARRFDWSYWRDLDSSGEYPHAFFNDMAAAGWVGAAIPEAYGGAGLGITEAALILGEICASGQARPAPRRFIFPCSRRSPLSSTAARR